MMQYDYDVLTTIDGQKINVRDVDCVHYNWMMQDIGASPEPSDDDLCEVYTFDGDAPLMRWGDAKTAIGVMNVRLDIPVKAVPIEVDGFSEHFQFHEVVAHKGKRGTWGY